MRARARGFMEDEPRTTASPPWLPNMPFGWALVPPRPVPTCWNGAHSDVRGFRWYGVNEVHDARASAQATLDAGNGEHAPKND